MNIMLEFHKHNIGIINIYAADKLIILYISQVIQ